MTCTQQIWKEVEHASFLVDYSAIGNFYFELYWPHCLILYCTSAEFHSVIGYEYSRWALQQIACFQSKSSIYLVLVGLASGVTYESSVLRFVYTGLLVKVCKLRPRRRGQFSNSSARKALVNTHSQRPSPVQRAPLS